MLFYDNDDGINVGGDNGYDNKDDVEDDEEEDEEDDEENDDSDDEEGESRQFLTMTTRCDIERSKVSDQNPFLYSERQISTKGDFKVT